MKVGTLDLANELSNVGETSLTHELTLADVAKSSTETSARDVCPFQYSPLTTKVLKKSESTCETQKTS
jgi:hypothetical protein